MSNDVQYKHQDVLYESGTSSVQTSRSSFGTGEHHSKILPNVACGRLQKSINYKKFKEDF